MLTSSFLFSDVSALYGPPADYFYGNYETLANLTVAIAGVTQYSSYRRSLDLEDAIHQTTFQANKETFTA
jgi:alpha-L-fucosidase 2